MKMYVSVSVEGARPGEASAFVFTERDEALAGFPTEKLVGELCARARMRQLSDDGDGSSVFAVVEEKDE